MICPLTQQAWPMFRQACHFDHVFGSRGLTAAQVYGLQHPRHRFYYSPGPGGQPGAAFYLNGPVLSVSAAGGPPPQELAQFVRQNGVAEVDTTLALAQALQQLLGGWIDSSFYMEYPHAEPPVPGCEGIAPTRDARPVFEVLRQSHEYYRTHLEYDPWSQDLEARWRQGVAQTALLTVQGRAVGTSSVISSDDEAGVVAAVAVVPECRGKGYGSALSAWATAKILEAGKKPVLISGRDEVARLYRRLGYRETGRWGELYL